METSTSPADSRSDDVRRRRRLKDRLHAELEEYELGVQQRILIHALIECGRVTAIECQYGDCQLGTRRFPRRLSGPARGRYKHDAGLVVDHIMSWRYGGSHRPENLQLLHAICNSRKAVREDADHRERWEKEDNRRWAEEALEILEDPTLE